MDEAREVASVEGMGLDPGAARGFGVVAAHTDEEGFLAHDWPLVDGLNPDGADADGSWSVPFSNPRIKSGDRAGF